MRRKKNPTEDILRSPTVPLRKFGTGEVARILETEIWRVQKYLDSPKYGIKPRAEPLGTGKGSRRLFEELDVFRLGIAEQLVRNGFSYKFVSAALQQLEDNDLLGPFSEDGEELDLIYLLSGGEDYVQIHGIGRDKTTREMAKSAHNTSFYILDLNDVIKRIQRKMKG
jgi:hypothetical protein